MYSFMFDPVDIDSSSQLLHNEITRSDAFYMSVLQIYATSQLHAYYSSDVRYLTFTTE